MNAQQLQKRQARLAQLKKQIEDYKCSGVAWILKQWLINTIDAEFFQNNLLHEAGFIESGTLPEESEEVVSLKRDLEAIRDLARTGLPPMDMTEGEWRQHKLNRVAAMADHALKGGE